MFTLKRFELQVSPTIIQRRRQYYEDGAIIDLEETDDMPLIVGSTGITSHDNLHS